MRIAAAAAVAHADVEETVGAECDPSAIMVRERLIDAEQRRGRVGEGLVRTIGHAVLDDLRVAVGVGVVDEEAAVLRIAGMEGEAEQALLVPAAHEVADVEEWLVRDRAVCEDEYPPRLIDHEEAAVAGRRGEENRISEILGDDLGRDVHAIDLRRLRRRERRPEQEGE